MNARRLFAASLPDDGGAVELEAEAARHVAVLRLGPGDPVCLFDGRGRVADGRLEVVERGRVVCRVTPPRAEASRGPRLVLVQAAPKGKKLETVVRMTTELGLDALLIAPSDHSVARPDPGRAAGKQVRLERIAREAARQSERAAAPSLETAATLLEAAARAPADALRLCFWARGGCALGEALREGEAPREVWMVVGPEGGLSEAELEGLEALGFVRVRLGPHVLRAETAAVAAVAAVMTRLCDEGDPDVASR